MIMSWRGSHPETLTLSDLPTGVDVHARVAAYTRGTLRGYSSWSASDAVETMSTATPAFTNLGLLTSEYTLTPTYVTSSVPAGAPPALANFVAEETLQVSEVQTITVGASHMREVQTITTSATVYGEVQTISTSASIGSTITGNIAMRIPEVQTITVSASSALTEANIKATFTHYVMPSPGVAKSTSSNTGVTA